MTTLLITGLLRDVFRDRSIVQVRWKDEPGKHLGLIVPSDCTREQLRAEAEKAVRALAKELESATIEDAPTEDA